MKVYSFNVDDAAIYGLGEAVMLYNLKHWISHNMANGTNTHDGRTWTYNSKKAFGRLFHFWSESQIKRILNSLIKQGVILTGNYNRSGYDRTLWYALVDERELLSWIGRNRPMEKNESSNGLEQNSQPIPDVNTDITTKKNMSGKPDHSDDRVIVIDYLNMQTGSKFKPHTAISKKHIDARLNDGCSVEDLVAVIQAKVSEWIGDSKMQKFLRPATLFGSKFDDYLATAHIAQPEKPKTSIDIMLDNLRETNDKTGSTGNNGQTISGNGITVGQDSISQAGDLCPAPQYMGKGNDPFGW